MLNGFEPGTIEPSGKPKSREIEPGLWEVTYTFRSPPIVSMVRDHLDSLATDAERVAFIDEMLGDHRRLYE